MEFSAETIRLFRLHSHHLDRKLPFESILEAAGACGLQNSPPGAWETALFCRLESCTLNRLQEALYRDKSLLQAWSFRGVPAVFPTREREVFLTALQAQPDEQPWIYTRGIAAALDFLGMEFDELLPLVKQAASCLENNSVLSKERMDQTLADLVLPDLPSQKRPLWNAPSMYGRPDRQTVGGAVVSFLLRPCSFSSLVVFGERQGASPVFTSLKTWLADSSEGSLPSPGSSDPAEPGKALVRKFLHCYGPASRSSFESWLGSSPRQARRLWDKAASEMTEVTVEGRRAWMLAEDLPALTEIPRTSDSGHDSCRASFPGRLLLLGAHDPWLDLRDRALILPEKSLHKLVWKTVANPGAILQDGSVIGIWKAASRKNGLCLSLTTWKPLFPDTRRTLETLAQEYADFRQLPLKDCSFDTV